MNIKELVPEKVESEINSPDHPTRRFVGFALLLAWHYNLWFLHDSFVGAQLLDDCVTQSWLIALVSAAVSFIIIAFALGRKHRLCNIPWMLWTATAAAVISTLAASPCSHSRSPPTLSHSRLPRWSASRTPSYGSCGASCTRARRRRSPFPISAPPSA